MNIPLMALGAVVIVAGSVLAGTAADYWTAAPSRRPRPGLQPVPGRRGGLLVAAWHLP